MLPVSVDPQDKAKDSLKTYAVGGPLHWVVK